MSDAIRKIGVFALSNAPDAGLLEKGCANLADFLHAEVVCDCQTTPDPRKMAGDDCSRARRFNELLADDSIDMLVAARGGYGVTRILDKIDVAALRRSGKWLCGYSDVSALLLYAWKNGCTRLIHGPMICSGWANIRESKECLREAELFRKLLEDVSDGNGTMRLESTMTLKRGCATAPLIPTNLTMLNSLVGTTFLPELSGTIIALEDVNEPAHSIDRKLNQLRQCGILGALKGLVFGHFTDADDGSFIPEILNEYAACIDGPVIIDYPLGHDHPSTPLVFGRNCTLEAN